MRGPDLAEKADYSQVLGVGRTASASESKSAYRRLARQHHPDVNREDGQAEERFKAINEAYEVLSDDEKRSLYDQFGHAGLNGGGDAGFGGMGPFDLIDLVFGGGRSRQRPHGPERGNDLRYDLEITLEEAANGVEREIPIARVETCSRCRGTGSRPDTPPQSCSTCRGSGQVQATQNTFLGAMRTITTCRRCGGRGQVIVAPCIQCNGEGAERKRVNVTVRIPAGIDDGQSVVARGDGEAGHRGGPSGDLYVFAHLRPHAVFERHGRDLVCEVSCSLARAALGGPIDVPTLDGPERLHLRPGTQPGDMFRVRGRGMPVVNRQGRGDLMVVVNLHVPKELNEKQRRALEDLATASGEEDLSRDTSRPDGKDHEAPGLFDWVKNIFGGKQDA